MTRSRTSKAWMKEHVSDPFVHRAKAEGYRSRAAFKLIEIDDRERLIRPDDTIVDLGASPGGWSQVVAARLKGTGQLVALDILAMEPIQGVDFIQGDFGDDGVLETLKARLRGQQAGLVLSDMAPNLSGIPASDQARIMCLAELSLSFAQRYLKPNGAFLVKVFQGSDFTAFVKLMRQTFKTVTVKKPDASRSRSAETYLLGRGL